MEKTILTSSSEFLQENFHWAMEKTNQFVVTGKRGPVNKDEKRKRGTGTADYIPSYWAGYFDRTAFYSRDYVHQTAGAHIAGLQMENYSMFKVFARNATEKRKWYTLWSFNFDGTPHIIDYKSDRKFVREVPAQFELVEKAYKLYLWTGDERYIYDEEIWLFCTKVMTDFIELHDIKNPNGLPEGSGNLYKGCGTYNEGLEHPLEAGDGIGTQYQATLAYAEMLKVRGEKEESAQYFQKAAELKRFFNEEWSVVDPANPEDLYARIVTRKLKKKNNFGRENSWYMPMKLITEPGQRNDNYLDFITEKMGGGIGTKWTASPNIEAYTYLPDTFFPYNRNEEAWKWMKYIRDVRDRTHHNPTQGTNGDYPEVSFTVLSHTLEGLMGIEPDAAAHFVATAPRLPKDVDWVQIESLKAGKHTLDIRHSGLTDSRLTNHGTEDLTWEARFYGEYSRISVDGQIVPARKMLINGVPVSSSLITVKTGQTRSASVAIEPLRRR